MDETVSVLFSELESFSAIGTFHLLFGGFGVPYGKVDGMEGGRREGDLKWEKGRVGREGAGVQLACRLKRFQPSLLKCETTDVAIHNLGSRRTLSSTRSGDTRSAGDWIRWAKKDLLIT